MNAAGLALQDANIRFRQKLTACTAAAYESDGVEYLLRDLNIMEELEVNFTTAVVLEPSGKRNFIRFTYFNLYPIYYRIFLKEVGYTFFLPSNNYLPIMFVTISRENLLVLNEICHTQIHL